MMEDFCKINFETYRLFQSFFFPKNDSQTIHLAFYFNKIIPKKFEQEKTSSLVVIILLAYQAENEVVRSPLSGFLGRKSANKRPPPPASAVENPQIIKKNSLYCDMLDFGMKNIASKAMDSHGVQLGENAIRNVTLVRTSKAPGLLVDFDANLADVQGKEQKVSMTVGYQSWKNNSMTLMNYTIAK